MVTNEEIIQFVKEKCLLNIQTDLTDYHIGLNDFDYKYVRIYLKEHESIDSTQLNILNTGKYKNNFVCITTMGESSRMYILFNKTK